MLVCRSRGSCRPSAYIRFHYVSDLLRLEELMHNRSMLSEYMRIPSGQLSCFADQEDGTVEITLKRDTPHHENKTYSIMLSIAERVQFFLAVNEIRGICGKETGPTPTLAPKELAFVMGSLTGHLPSMSKGLAFYEVSKDMTEAEIEHFNDTARPSWHNQLHAMNEELIEAAGRCNNNWNMVPISFDFKDLSTINRFTWVDKGEFLDEDKASVTGFAGWFF